ncbi:hypothetical protein BKA00_004899 [Actinomadura coerulea]|uniref:Secreted protein n=1 Tax=Actinomadura coerulea TaxID=46159 RepID=A0A7X0G225_9ACTN|nr:hypothetical protein [Actinomadura coerulea]MBB6397985.1 hypothetical protein [Actinomadura coerulea]GGQ33026.1 hypothetical protein GCM10010187_57520 [Actinomadura coerulea]
MKIGKASRRILSAAVAGAAVVCGTLLTTAPEASAVTWKYTMHTDDGDPGAVIKFQPNGDYVQVCDIEADGKGAFGVVYLNGSPYYNLIAGGKGNCSTTNANYHNLPEYKTIAFKICLSGYSTTSGLKYCDSAAWYNG